MSLLERIYFFHSRVQENRFPNAVDIMEEFEISSATAHRDIAYLRERLLAPLAFDQGKNGYFYQDQQFRLPFEESPRLMFFLGVLGSLGKEAGLSGLPELEQLQQRLAELVVPGGQRLQDMIHCEWVEVEPVAEKVLQPVMQGLLEKRRLDITYRRSEETTSRQVDPRRLINYQGRWYLLAWCHLRQERRLFHLARVVDATRTDLKVVERGEDDQAFLGSVFGIFKGEPRIRVVIDFFGHAAEVVRLQRWHPGQILEETATGIRLSLPVADAREVMMKVLQFGAQARVIAPPSLVARIAHEVQAMRELYDARDLPA